MIDMRQREARFWSDSGQDLIEYSLLASLISLAAVAAVLTLGATIEDLWSAVTGMWP